MSFVGYGTVLRGYFHFGNNHVLIQLAFSKNIFQMLVNGGSLYSKQLSHSFLRQPDGFIADDGVDGNILLRRVVHQKAEGVVHAGVLWVMRKI